MEKQDPYRPRQVYDICHAAADINRLSQLNMALWLSVFLLVFIGSSRDASHAGFLFAAILVAFIYGNWKKRRMSENYLVSRVHKYFEEVESQFKADKKQIQEYGYLLEGLKDADMDKRYWQTLEKIQKGEDWKHLWARDPAISLYGGSIFSRIFYWNDERIRTKREKKNAEWLKKSLEDIKKDSE